MKKRSLLVLSFFVGIAFLLAACGPDRQLGYQAVLTGSGGVPVANGTYTVIVKYWDSLTGGSVIYQDTQTVTVTNGMLNIAIPDLVAEADALDPGLFSQPLWVELTINGETLSPRQKLLGTPYAYTLVGGAVVSAGPLDTDVAPLVADAPGRGALTVGNGFTSSAAGSPGATGLVVAIADTTDAEVIRACAGVTCEDDYRVFSVNSDGDVSQSAAGDGLVKAAVYAMCHTTTYVTRSFNNVTGAGVTIADGAAAGECTLDFGFDISNRYWVASAPTNASRIVNCTLNATNNNKLNCYRFDNGGSGFSGTIMVMVY
jgi:hypothetical protein